MMPDTIERLRTAHPVAERGWPLPASRPTLLLALADEERTEEIATLLSEERGLAVLHANAMEAGEGIDAILTDGEPLDERTPHVLLVADRVEANAPVAPNVRAVLAEDTAVELVAAALALAAAGYRIARDAPATPDGTAHAQLTPRELEVLELLSEGAANKVIARRLDISVHTAKFHVAAIIAKLGAVNRTDAIATALREGLVHL